MLRKTLITANNVTNSGETLQLVLKKEALETPRTNAKETAQSLWAKNTKWTLAR